MSRFGILGGSFDPIHNGHLMMALEARAQLGLDQVFLVPSGNPPHKGGQCHCPALHRYRMVELAARGEPGLVPLRLEVDKEGPSYTVETLRIISLGLAPGDELYFILGSDAFAELDTWREPDEVSALARFAVAGRAGNDGMANWPRSCPSHRAVIFDVPVLAISSTDIRSRIAEGRPFRYMVPDAVGHYLLEHCLYQTAP